MTNLTIGLVLLALNWALLSGTHRLLASRPETSWVHRGGLVQFVSLTSTGLMALGALFLIRFMAGAGWAASVVTVAGIVAVLVAARMLSRRLRRPAAGGTLPGGPAAAV